MKDDENLPEGWSQEEDEARPEGWKKKPRANISYWLPWWNRMEREAEKLREELEKNRISKYLKPMKPTSCPRVVCSSENSVIVAKERPLEMRQSLCK